jgi:N-acetyl-anhydromuramyl-L-alanine amidase AmpD
VLFLEQDFEVIRQARIETLKMMSLTNPSVFERLHRENPGLEFIVRLYDDRINRDSRPSPEAFVARAVPIIRSLKPYATKFEIHNEPNHADGIEGWGPSDANARSFRAWYLRVLAGLRKACPWARLGFPGLALNHPHRDLAWLDVCRDAIEASDWLGCHSYWQHDNMLSDGWGLRFRLYHQRFPDKPIEITEFGNSTPNLPRDEMARQYVRYYQELNRYPYLGSASCFIASSPDPAWAAFVWLKESGEVLPVVREVGNMERQPVEVPPWPAPPEPKRRKLTEAERRFQEVVQLLLAFGPGKPSVDLIVDDLPKHATKRYAIRPLIDIEQIVIHHTATGRKLSPERLAEYQVDKQGKPGIGYHFFVAADGTVHQTNWLETVSDHARSHSQASIGICFPRKYSTAVPTPSQHEAGGQLCAWLLGAFRLPSGAIVGLSEIASTQSPGRQWLSGKRWKDLLLERVEVAMEAHQDELTNLIASLQDKIKALQAEVERLRAQTPRGRIARPAIRNLIDELPTHKEKEYETRALEDIRYLVVHHSAVPPNVGAKSIASYHVTRRNWPAIGYHFVVDKSGAIFQCNTLETISYHAAGVNTPSVGICLLGSFMGTQVPPQGQIQRGARLIAWLLDELGLPQESVRGHGELMDTACPGNQWLTGVNWKQSLLEEIARIPQETAPTGTKPIYHYMLFWAREGEWAKTEWLSAQNYIGAFLPTTGFSLADASLSEYVTVVGALDRLPQQVEDWLKSAGCTVDRIAGKDGADTKRILDELSRRGKRFLNFDTS